MDLDGLPIIGPGVDYTQVRAIHQKRTLAFINHFILNTVAFLNKFSRSCEVRFEKFESQIQKLEASLCILETKLTSISGLETIAAVAPAEPKLETQVITKDNSAVLPTETAEISFDKTIEGSSLDKTIEASPLEAIPSAAHDERFAKFFKMIQVGVPIQAVRIKMQAEGLDPSVLDKPNEPATPATAKTHIENNTSDSESTASSFSD